jgi:hypothetical protein
MLIFKLINIMSKIEETFKHINDNWKEEAYII